jgi:hypothetical protein
VREAIQTQPTGMPIQRNTLPTAISRMSAIAIGFAAMVRRSDGRARSAPGVAGT